MFFKINKIFTIPRGEKDEPLFEQAQPNVTADAFLELYDTPAEAKTYIDAAIKKLQKDVVTKPKPTGNPVKDASQSSSGSKGSHSNGAKSASQQSAQLTSREGTPQRG
jgi:hypothetical protein